MLPSMYVIVRNDLSTQYKFVQGGHALSQYSLDHPKLFQEWGNHRLIYLGARNLIELRKIENSLINNHLTYSSFKEEDLEYQLTGLACYDTGEIFKGLRVA